MVKVGIGDGRAELHIMTKVSWHDIAFYFLFLSRQLHVLVHFVFSPCLWDPMKFITISLSFKGVETARSIALMILRVGAVDEMKQAGIIYQLVIARE